MTEIPEALIEIVADAMVEHGPDGHCDGAKEIAQAAFDWINANDATTAAKQRYRLLSDNDGHYYLVPVDYLVPVESENAFNEWVDSFNEDEESDPDGYVKLGAQSLGCSPPCVSFVDPKVD